MDKLTDFMTALPSKELTMAKLRATASSRSTADSCLSSRAGRGRAARRWRRGARATAEGDRRLGGEGGSAAACSGRSYSRSYVAFPFVDCASVTVLVLVEGPNF